MGIGSGDEVITVANTFYATAGAIVAVGAKPVFVDCDKRMQIDPLKIEAAISERTKAIVPVHWGGACPEMVSVMLIASKHNLKVVEDACPSVGANINGKAAGTWGDINAFSMHPLKPLNVWGDGGMVVTDSDDLANWIKRPTEIMEWSIGITSRCGELMLAFSPSRLLSALGFSMK